MSSAVIYSERLGAISDAQFDAAVRKAGLGRFMAARTPTAGLFGQNVFLTTTAGEFVFRGAPHWWNGAPDDRWQFPKERFYADLLHARTSVPVAWPQMLDTSGADFPWPYLIMPRLTGVCLQDDGVMARLGRQDLEQIARAMGQALAELHGLTWSSAGDYDPGAEEVVAYPGGHGRHLAAAIGYSAAATRGHGALKDEDEAWLEALIGADAATPTPAAATYVHNDYTLGNVLFENGVTGWRVSGVVDLMTSCFGDPTADLVRPACAWLDSDSAYMRAFLAAYRDAGGPAAPSPARLALLVAYERLLIWGYFTRPDVDHAGLRGKTFGPWARRYAERLATALGL